MANSTLTQYIIRHQLMVKVAGIILFTVILVFVAIVPLMSSISQNSRSIATRDKERVALVDKVTLLSQLDLQVLDDRLRILDTALPPRKDIVAYLAAIDGLSKELGLTFGGLSISPGEVTDKPEETVKKTVSGLQTLDTTIKVKGSQESIYTFLRSVEQTLPLMQIKDVKVAGAGEGAYSLSLSMGMLWAPAGSADVKGALTLFNEDEEAYFQTLSGYRSYKADIFDSATTNIDSGRTDLFAR